MPLSDYGRLIASLLQQLGEGLLVSVEALPVGHEAVEVAVFAGLNDGPARSANAVRHIASVEQHSFLRDPIHIRSRHSRGIVGTEGLLAVIVGENEDDVGAVLAKGHSSQGEKESNEGSHEGTHGLSAGSMQPIAVYPVQFRCVS